MRICLSVDFDALSGYLGTGHTPENTLSDYSAGLLSANVGVPRLLRLFAKHRISDNVTWFIPGHSIETFPDRAAEIAASGAEIGLHGYSHEGAYAMTPAQEDDVLERCTELVTGLLRGRGTAAGASRADSSSSGPWATARRCTRSASPPSTCCRSAGSCTTAA